MMISFRTLSTLRFSPGSRRSPTDASPIFFSARTDWNRTSGSRSWLRACSNSGMAAAPRRMPSPSADVRRMPSWLSLSLARSAVTTDSSTGTSGSTTVSAYSSTQGLMRLPNLLSAAVGPVWRGRCRFTSACTARSRMSASLSAESCDETRERLDVVHLLEGELDLATDAGVRVLGERQKGRNGRQELGRAEIAGGVFAAPHRGS